MGSPAVVAPPPEAESAFLHCSLDEIINGKTDEFPGLLPLIEVYLKGMNLEFDTRSEEEGRWIVGKKDLNVFSAIHLTVSTTGLIADFFHSLPRRRLNRYLTFISQRASGHLLTAAQWMRKFIRSHADYKFDSVVSDSITYDLVERIRQLNKGLCGGGDTGRQA